MPTAYELGENEVSSILFVLRDYARIKGIVPKNFVGDSSGMTHFAEACVDDNSLEEIVEGLPGLKSVDLADCEGWIITQKVWRLSIRQAAAQKLQHLIDCFEE